MAEVAASLIGIATFGVKLTTTLYEFGANAASAREQTDRIARHLRLYSEVLEVLVDRIDDGEPIHSAKALRLVDEIYDQSCDLFDNIKDMIPKRGDRMSFLRKIAWNFKKSRVALLVSEIEYLKSTVTLLVTVLFAGKKLRSSRRKRRSRKDSKKDREEVDLEYAKVKIAIVEQINASAHKLDMQAKVEEEERNEPETMHDNRVRALTRPGTGVLQHSMDIVNFKESLGRTEDQSEERALVLHHSDDLMANLLHQWTTLADDATSSTANQGNRESGDLGASKTSQQDQASENLPMDDSQQGEATSSKISKKQQAESSREEKHRNMLTEAYLDVRNRAERAEEELARLKASWQHAGKSKMPELSHSRTQGQMADTPSSPVGQSVKFIPIIDEPDQEHWFDSGVILGINPDDPEWKAQQRQMQSMIGNMKVERAAELEGILERKKSTSGLQLLTFTSSQSQLNSDSISDWISSPSHTPWTRVAANTDEENVYPELARHAEYFEPQPVRYPDQQTTNMGNEYNPKIARRFKEGSKAYEVRSKMYDDYDRGLLPKGGQTQPPPGAEGTPGGGFGGMPGGFNFGGMPGGAGGTRSFHFTSNGGQGFHFSDPNDTFSNFTRGGATGGPDDEDTFNLFSGSFNGGRSAGIRRATDTRRPPSNGNHVKATGVDRPIR